jgi:cytochrome c-type biogenesis protein CcmF
MVLLGTLYPIIGDALGIGRISVGPPYFGFVFPLLMLPVVLLIPFGPFFRWAAADWRATWRSLRPAVILAVVAALVAVLLFPHLPSRGIVGVAATFWVGAGIVLYALKRWREAPAGRRYTPEMLGMILAHLGLAVFLAGVLITSAASVESDLRFAPNETQQVGGLDFRFTGVTRVNGPNYLADQGTIEVRDGANVVATLHPQKRQYAGQQMQSVAAIQGGVFRDIYVALGDPLGNNAWAVRIYVKPFVRWIWAGGLFMLFGGLTAAADRRFRAKRSAADEVAPVAAPMQVPA